MKKLSILLFALCLLLLFSCNNGFNNATNSSISFSLPCVYGGEGGARAVQLDDSAFYVVKCENVKTGRVVFFDDNVVPGKEVNIHNVLAGSYSIEIKLYQKDIWTSFENSIVLTSSKTAECEVKENVTTNVEIKMPSPVYEDIDYYEEFMPICVNKDLYCILTGNAIGIRFTSKEAVPEKIKVTVESKGDSESTMTFVDRMREYYQAELTDRKNALLKKAIENKQPFTLSVYYNEEQTKCYTIKLSSFVSDYIEAYINMEPYESDECCFACNKYLFAINTAKDPLLITKTNPPRIFYLGNEVITDNYDGKSYYLDSVGVEGSDLLFNQKLYFQAEENVIKFCVGKNFKDVEELKSILGNTFKDETKINIKSSVDSKRNIEVTLPAKCAICINQWLNGEEVTFPEVPKDGTVSVGLDCSDL